MKDRSNFIWQVLKIFIFSILRCIALHCISCCLQANCKHITALEKFSGHCEPVFVFYQVEQNVSLSPAKHQFINKHTFALQDGRLLNTVTGVNAPVLCTSIDKWSAEAAAAVAIKA